jgi:hypothetical protein
MTFTAPLMELIPEPLEDSSSSQIVVPEPLAGDLQGQNYFRNNAKRLFAFSTLILSEKCAIAFSILCDMAPADSKGDLKI